LTDVLIFSPNLSVFEIRWRVKISIWQMADFWA